MKKRRTGKIIAIIAIIMMLASQMSVSAFAEADAEDQPHDVTVEQITETEEDAAMETDEAAPNVEIGGADEGNGRKPGSDCTEGY